MKNVRMDWGVTIKSLWWGFYPLLSTDGFAITGSVPVPFFSLLRCRFQEWLVSQSAALKALEQSLTSTWQTLSENQHPFKCLKSNTCKQMCLHLLFSSLWRSYVDKKCFLFSSCETWYRTSGVMLILYEDRARLRKKKLLLAFLAGKWWKS